MRFLFGFALGIVAGYLLGLIIPIEVFIAACLVLAGMLVLLLFLFHLGVRDFQEY